MAIRTLLIICRAAAGGRTEKQLAEAAETGVLVVDNPGDKPMEELIKVVLVEGESPLNPKTTTAPADVQNMYEAPPSAFSYSPEDIQKQLDTLHLSVGQT